MKAKEEQEKGWGFWRRKKEEQERIFWVGSRSDRSRVWGLVWWLGFGGEKSGVRGEYIEG